jgi:uncharacterized membrane protein YkoI
MFWALMGAALPQVAQADEDHDHDRARDLYQRGEIRALSDILPVVHAVAPGDIVTVDLIRLGDRWAYRFQVVAGDGRRSTVDVDARSAVILPDAGKSR